MEEDFFSNPVGASNKETLFPLSYLLKVKKCFQDI